MRDCADRASMLPMPTTVRDGLHIHYTDTGSGTPVLLLNGLGAGAAAWDPLLPLIAESRRLIIVDHRGTGLSDPSRGRFSIADLADDAAAVLDTAGISSAHVVGNSLGGMVAQEMALRHPRSMRSLVLAATTPGVVAVPSHPSLPYHLLRALAGGGAARRRHLDAAFHGPATLVDAPYRLACDPTIEHLPQGDGARRQLGAALRWTSVTRLRRITAPTLVLHGTHDRLVPLPNARLLARLIPNSRLVTLERSGHFFITDAASAAGRAMDRFLLEVDYGFAAAPARRMTLRPAFRRAVLPA
jgi:pimeloyl-ACP methyl ester carboxylesterase